MRLQEFLDSEYCPKYVNKGNLVINVDEDNNVVSCYEGDIKHYPEEE